MPLLLLIPYCMRGMPQTLDYKICVEYCYSCYTRINVVLWMHMCVQFQMRESANDEGVRFNRPVRWL